MTTTPVTVTPPTEFEYPIGHPWWVLFRSGKVMSAESFRIHEMTADMVNRLRLRTWKDAADLIRIREPLGDGKYRCDVPDFRSSADFGCTLHEGKKT